MNAKNPFAAENAAEFKRDVECASKLSDEELEWIKERYYYDARLDLTKADAVLLVHDAIRKLLIEIYRSRKLFG